MRMERERKVLKGEPGSIFSTRSIALCLYTFICDIIYLPHLH